MGVKEPWTLSPQPNKFGYVNNPDWVDDASATPAHLPCGYWWKRGLDGTLSIPDYLSGDGTIPGGGGGGGSEEEDMSGFIAVVGELHQGYYAFQLVNPADGSVGFTHDDFGNLDPDMYSWGLCACKDISGNIYIARNFYNDLTGVNTGIITSYAPDGSVRWEQSFEYEFFYVIECDAFHVYAAGGYYEGIYVNNKIIRRLALADGASDWDKSLDTSGMESQAFNSMSIYSDIIHLTYMDVDMDGSQSRVAGYVSIEKGAVSFNTEVTLNTSASPHPADIDDRYCVSTNINGLFLLTHDEVVDENLSTVRSVDLGLPVTTRGLTGIHFDSDDSFIYVVGKNYTGSTSTGDSCYIAKFELDGTLMWEKDYTYDSVPTRLTYIKKGDKLYLSGHVRRGEFNTINRALLLALDPASGDVIWSVESSIDYSVFWGLTL